ncbi:hypothetical protein NKW45_09590 [Acetobacter orientalis]|uniref:hypothetical protein n=1 Tax=Acetobacter orientalis TaxID=146474 RepID=UPI0020A44AAC|nr:hypothetical protein [Acetobacter orientalis]MCP1222096.1 hypothetical protein [Acetobacter orientalis]
MRKAALVAVCLSVSGCSGFGKYVSDTATLPGENPNAPAGSDLNMRRVYGYHTAETPILPQGGNIWPGPPPPLPTLEDVEKDRSGTALDGGSGQDVGAVLQDGSEMSLSDHDKKAEGGKLPDAEPDVAERYGAKRGNASTIEIPNGDGSVTLIHPDGTVTTVPAKKNTPASAH